MMDSNEIVRRRIVFKGRVQGVGFRYRAQQAAVRLGVTGWVRNEDDFETVTMEAQGSILQIRDLIRSIQQGRYVQIEDMRVQEIPALPDERSFKVKGYWYE